ncbi:MAG: hypothetical protein IRZ04_16240 [Rhodospirillales bacterium]|nr:hypothetical protein [Rhodospirillales bacterium]
MRKLHLAAALVLLPALAFADEVARVAVGAPHPAAAEDGGEEGDAPAGFLAGLAAERPPLPSEADLVRAFVDRWGVPCREYVQRVYIDDTPVEASGTVCRTADGSWALRE